MTTPKCSHGYAASKCPICEVAIMVRYDNAVKARLATERADRLAKGIVEITCG